jgi:predicted phosphodiesterase
MFSMSLEAITEEELKKDPRVLEMLRMAKKNEQDKYKEQLEQIKTSEEYKLVKKLEKDGMSPQEIMDSINQLKRGNPNSNETYSVGKSHSKFLVIGDSHIGNIQYKPNLLSHAVKVAKKEKVDFIVHVGDIVDGWYQNRPTSLFEQNAIGMDAQMDMAVKEFKKLETLGKPFYFITGNHEYNTYMRGAGVEFGKILEQRLNLETNVEAHYLGNGEANLALPSGSIIKLSHPDGGTAYAISYKTQKMIESFTGGEKPNVLLMGHFHKAEYLFDRNIHAFQTGTLCGQTKFMRGKQLPSHTGFWIVDLYTKQGGQVDRISPQFYPAYS